LGCGLRAWQQNRATWHFQREALERCQREEEELRQEHARLRRDPVQSVVRLATQVET
jgi:hypothetical protein